MQSANNAEGSQVFISASLWDQYCQDRQSMEWYSQYQYTLFHHANVYAPFATSVLAPDSRALLERDVKA